MSSSSSLSERRRVSAIRVWSDSGLELVTDSSSSRQQIATKLSSLRTALDECRRAARLAQSSSSHLPTIEAARRIRHIAIELDTVEAEMKNDKAFTHLNVANGKDVDVSDDDLPPPSPLPIPDSPLSDEASAAPSAAASFQPSFRQITALRNSLDTLLTELTGRSDIKQRRFPPQLSVSTTMKMSVPPSTNDDSPDTASPLPNASPNSHGLTTPMSKDGSNRESAPVISDSVAAQLATTAVRQPSLSTPSTPASASVLTSSLSTTPQISSNVAAVPPIATGNGAIYNNTVDVFTISRWGELLREPRKQLSKEQIRAKQQRIQLDEERELKWIKMCKNFEKYEGTQKLKKRVRKGIPDSVRAAVWPKFTGAIKEMQRNQGVYRRRLNEPCDLEDVISRDIARTFPHHLMFRDDLGSSGGDGETVSGDSQGRRSLFNVLKAYANHDKQVGYCQGMGFIVGLFLMYMNEEESFWMLQSLMRSPKYMMYGLYAPGFPLLHQYFYQFEQLLWDMSIPLKEHLAMNGIAPALYATQWFITVFAYNMPFEIVLRIWDIFLYEGPKIPFRFALYFMQTYEKRLLAYDLEGIIQTIKDLHNDPMMNDPDGVVNGAMKVPLTRDKLDAYAREYDHQQGIDNMQQRAR